MSDTHTPTHRLANAATRLADTLDQTPEYAHRADDLRAAAADLTRPLTRKQRREVTALTALLLSGPVALALAVLALALLLSGCSWAAYVRAGDPCDTIGDTARSKTGYAMVCKEPTSTDPTGTPRWRRA